MRTCTGSSTPSHRRGAASCPSTQTASTPAHSGGAAFVVQRKRKALGGTVEVHSVDMNAANQLVAFGEAVVAPWQRISRNTTLTSIKLQLTSYFIKPWTLLF